MSFESAEMESTESASLPGEDWVEREDQRTMKILCQVPKTSKKK